MKNTALITGATSGLGLAYAKEYAKKGYNLIITGRREDKIKANARNIENRYNVTVKVVIVDLAHEKYMESLDYFLGKAEEHKVEVALSNHTALDCGLERIEYARKRMSYMPNIYVIGQEGFRRYYQLFRNLCHDRMKSLKND